MMTKRFSLLMALAAMLVLVACLSSQNGASGRLAQITPTPTPFLPDFTLVLASDGQSAPAAGSDQPAGVGDPAKAEPGDILPAKAEDFPAAAELSDINVPAPVGRIVAPEGQVNVMILGSDQRPNDGGFRTDVMLLLSMNPDGTQASLTSFPRDLYVFQPGWRVDRINSAFTRGGLTMLADTMEYNFGVRPDHYVLVNFWNFETIVDTLGGVNVQVAQGLCDHRDSYGNYCVSAGTVTMDGETALWYVRSRGTSSDFQRTHREQEVLQAIFYKLMSLDAVTRAPELYAQYNDTVSTDITLGDILPLLPLAADIASGDGEISRYAVGPDQVTSFTTSGGGAVLLPDLQAIQSIMKQALNVANQ